MAHRARTPTRLSVDQFLDYYVPEGKAELVRGEVRVNPPTGARHGLVVTNVLVALVAHVQPRRLGVVLTDAGFELAELPRTVRAPDVAFVRAQRVPEGAVTSGFWRFAPDLAVEVLSPSETAARLDEKLADYSVASVPLVWVIDPEAKTVMVTAAQMPTRWLRAADTLDAGDVIPGFSCPVSELFAGIGSK